MEKTYERVSIVMDKRVVRGLRTKAEADERSLNWEIKKACSEYLEKRGTENDEWKN